MGSWAHVVSGVYIGQRSSIGCKHLEGRPSTPAILLSLTHVVEPDRYVVVDRVQRGDDDGEEDLGAEFEEFEVSPLLDDDVPPLLQLEDDPHGGEHDQQAEGDDRNGDAVP